MNSESEIVLVDEENQVGEMSRALLAGVSLHGVFVHLARPGAVEFEDVFVEAFPKKPEMFMLERIRDKEKLVTVKRIKTGPLYRQNEHPHKGRHAHLLEQKEKLRQKLRDNHRK